MIITRRAIPRRTVLRGLGATLALPLLDGMIPALSAQATAAKPVHRFGVVYVPNGVIHSAWLPGTEGAAYELSPTLAPLAPFRDRMVVISGLSCVSPPGRPVPRFPGMVLAASLSSGRRQAQHEFISTTAAPCMPWRSGRESFPSGAF